MATVRVSPVGVFQSSTPDMSSEFWNNSHPIGHRITSDIEDEVAQ